MNAPASAADPAQRNLAGRRLGRYEVLTQLASGGMAAVYVARAQGVAGFERLVAVKVLHPHLAHEDEFISMFLDEARLAARIRHPNVVATLDISDTQGDGFFIVMDYIEGDHLGALLQRAARQGKRLPAGAVSRVIVDALQGLSAAHNLTDEHGQPLNLVHRDVSPHNVMVGVDGIARLTDFGVAKAEVRLTSTREGQFKGKLAYMAPEQASTGNADQRSDLFSMGIILWESLTGRRLFRGENNAETLHKVLQSEIPPPSSLWPELEPFDEIVLRALDRDPEKRFQTAEELAEAIEDAARVAGGLATSRAVGDVVRTYTSEKLQQERERIKGAIEFLGRTDISETALPLPREASQSLSAGTGSSSMNSLSSISVSGRRRLDIDHNTLAARPGALGPPPLPNEGGSNKMVIILAAVVLLLLGAVGAFAFVALGKHPSPAPTVEVVPSTPPSEPAAVPPAAGPGQAAAPSEGAATPGNGTAKEAAKQAEQPKAEPTAAEPTAAERPSRSEHHAAPRSHHHARRAAARRAAQQAAAQAKPQEQPQAAQPAAKPEPSTPPAQTQQPAAAPKPKPKPTAPDEEPPMFNPYR